MWHHAYTICKGNNSKLTSLEEPDLSNTDISICLQLSGY